MKPWQILLYGLILGVLLGGAILLISRPVQGTPVILLPAPSATPTLPPAPTKTPEPILVQISGEVKTPGLYSVSKGSRLQNLIALAGGVSPAADESRINYAALLHDGDYYYLPAPDETIPETATNSPFNLKAGQDMVYDYPLDLNEADQEALESLPGIGPSKAADIITYRDEHGNYSCLDDLTRVPGIGAATVESLREYLYVEP